jgi:hypothetical protein
MRFVVAKRQGRRGGGLGNEILPWAKGWIASQVLDAHLVGPSWGMNKRRYDRNFGTSRLDFLLEDALLRLPHYEFTQADYQATCEIDFRTALEKWASVRGLTKNGSYIVSVEGMWGGYPSIREARSFLLAKLLNSRDALRNSYQIASRLDHRKLFVAVHMRLAKDGFLSPQPGENVRGKFNIFVPIDWYLWVCESLKTAFGEDIEFRFFTDRRGPEFDEAVRRFNPGQIVQQGLTECSDLLLMSRADLRVCSVSSYSLAACFLSEGPFLWYEPQLTLSHGLYSLWGQSETRHPTPGLTPATSRNGNHRVETRANGIDHSRAYLGSGMKIDDRLPESLVQMLRQRLILRDSKTNLLEYGSVPQVYTH